MRRNEFEDILDKALHDLPDWVTSRLDNVVVVAMDAPSPDQKGADRPEDLLGEYVGVSLPDRAADYWGALPDEIRIYRLPHVDLGLSRTETEEEVRRTLLHELGHYLGFTEQRLHELGLD